VTYGEWPSPISARLVAAAQSTATWPSIVDGEVWWCVSDPRTATVRLLHAQPGQPATEALGPDWSVRTKLLGYGGRAYLVTTGPGPRLIVFAHHGDQRLYRADLAGTGTTTQPRPLTPPDPDGTVTCYAEPVPAPDATEVWCLREVSVYGADPEAPPTVSRQIVAVPLDGSAAADPAAIRTVATSHHFLTGARVSPDGRRLAWIGWDHPMMPWDSTEVMVADLVDGVATGARRVLGGDEVSVPQLEWAGPDALYAMADPDGWWNLHRVDLRPDGASARCVLPMARECAGALWQVGSTWFAVTDAGVVLRHGVGPQRLAVWDPATGDLRGLVPAWTRFAPDIAGTGAGDGHPAVVVVAAAEDRERTVLYVPLSDAEPVACTAPAHEELRPWNPTAVRRTAIGVGGRDVHYVYYPPTNPDVAHARDGRPPLLVHAHGGPTSSTDASLNLEFGLFCSRGFAVASVDYGGSTGYGREYRDRLRHNWGIVDVEDCVAVARDLAAHGLADPARTAVRGGSAGGWTAIACLATTDVFCAGAVYYPISDPLAWSGASTHDFESQYLRSLIGELPADLEHYRRVSPLANADRIRSPMVVLQGADDVICRPDQAQRIVDAVAARGLWHRYLVFPGEGHGFRKESSVAASLEAEAELYSAAMGIAVDLA
jgi:poly(3-hydroxybutyrate) depolymerase